MKVLGRFVHKLSKLRRGGRPGKGKPDALKLRRYPAVEGLETRFLLTITGLTAHGPFSGPEGVPLATAPLATFSSDDLRLSDLSVSVDWGGSVAMAGATVSTTSGGPGHYEVVGQAYYIDEGTYTISFTVSDDNSEVNGSATADISDAALTAGSLSVPTGVSEGQSGQVTFHFSDANHYATTADFSGSVAWGDGTTTTGLAITGTYSNFQIQASHVYSEELTGGTITVTAIEDGGTSVSKSGTINVSDPSVNLSGEGPFKGVEGTSTPTLTLATFTDPAGPEVLDEYSATIDWGDGGSSTGTISYDSGTGLFTVVGPSHFYTDDNTGDGEASFGIQVTVNHGTSTAAEVTDPITVREPYVMFASPPVFYTTEPASGSNPSPSSPLTVVLSSVSNDPVTVVYQTIDYSCG